MDYSIILTQITIMISLHNKLDVVFQSLGVIHRKKTKFMFSVHFKEYPHALLLDTQILIYI